MLLEWHMSCVILEELCTTYSSYHRMVPRSYRKPGLIFPCQHFWSDFVTSIWVSLVFNQIWVTVPHMYLIFMDWGFLRLYFLFSPSLSIKPVLIMVTFNVENFADTWTTTKSAKIAFHTKKLLYTYCSTW